MFDDEVTSPTSFSTGSKYYKVAKFPTKNIRTPIVLVYGGSDSLVDIQLMLKELPKHTVAKCVPKYEHLDLLWASDVDKLVFPHVLDALESYAQQAHTKQQALGWRPTRPSIFDTTAVVPNGTAPPGYSDDERSRHHSVNSFQAPAFADERPSTSEAQLDESDEDDNYHDETPLTFTPSAFSHSSRPPIMDAAATGMRPGSAGVSAIETAKQETLTLP